MVLLLLHLPLPQVLLDLLDQVLPLLLPQMLLDLQDQVIPLLLDQVHPLEEERVDQWVQHKSLVDQLLHLLVDQLLYLMLDQLQHLLLDQFLPLLLDQMLQLKEEGVDQRVQQKRGVLLANQEWLEWGYFTHKVVLLLSILE